MFYYTKVYRYILNKYYDYKIKYLDYKIKKSENKIKYLVRKASK